MTPMANTVEKLVLAAPRGYCAGVDRAVQTVEQALRLNGAPVYVRKEIVHNKHVVEELRERGAIFVEEETEVPEGAVCVFSAHGVAPSVRAGAIERRLKTIDATCPLVTKVHREAEIHHRKGREIVLIGHAGHPEVEGTMGQLPEGSITLIETEADARAFQPKSAKQLAFITQTTLSVDDTAAIVAVLSGRFPEMVAPHKEDICYATTNRQEAVKRVAHEVDAMIVIGAPNSSNSQRLREVALRGGCPVSLLVQRAAEIDWSQLGGIRRLGITAGASAPEVLVEEVIAAFAERFTIKVELISAAEESVTFNLPRALRDAAE
jgi:4-hydroxy-3-methylbut-2-en-1-yl diphosphate reductase